MIGIPTASGSRTPGIRPRESGACSVFSETCMSIRPLLPAAGAAWLSYLAFVILLFSPAIRAYDAGRLPYSEGLRGFADLLAPNALLSGGPDSAATVAAVSLYLAIVAVTLGSWCWAMRAACPLHMRSPLPLIGLTAMVATPLLIAPGLFSDDVYLYNLYGRAIAVYGANPILSPPAAFPSDPHLPWVFWQELPSSYGPIWLMLSALLSALAADSVTAVAVLYRLAGLGLHLVTVAVLWRVLHRQRYAAALPAVIFYAWNPLVLLEVVANAHNDVLVALFAIPLVGAAMERRWSRAAIYAACALMVKPFAVVFVPAVARRLWQDADPQTRYKQLAIAASVGTAVVLALSLPLWSGDALIRNALHNPAASGYTNSLWELALAMGPDWSRAGADEVQHPYVDVVRGLAFFAGAAWVLTRRALDRDVPQVAVRLWLVFCLTACWVWPWYFVPVLALAPLAGAACLPTAAALTIGGLLFWGGWPERSVKPLALLYEWRSLLLFGPLLLTWIWPRARSLLSLPPGMRRQQPGGDAARLQPAAE